MYLVQISYKRYKYTIYFGKQPDREILNIRTLYKGNRKLIHKLQIILNKLYFDDNKTDLCVCVDDKDELSLLLVDNFITHYAGEGYNSKHGFYGDLPTCTGATSYLQSISSQLNLFNIDDIVDSLSYNLNDKLLQDILIENKTIFENIDENIEENSDCE